MTRAVAAAALLVAVLAVAAARPSGSGPTRLEHIFVIMLENHSDESVVGDVNAPFITRLARRYGHAARYYGVTHTSLPNYIALTSGSNWWVNDDAPSHRFPHRNLIDQLEAKHLSWVAYMESMPKTGYLGPYYPSHKVSVYVARHNPFILYPRIRKHRERRSHIKPYTFFAADMRKETVPNLVWISPNICHDMHGGVTVRYRKGDGSPCPSGYDNPADASLKRKADAFVKAAVRTIMRSPAWSEPSAIFILSDETTETGRASTGGYKDATGCCDSPYFAGKAVLSSGLVWNGGMYGGGSAVGVIVSNVGKRHFVSKRAFNHYSTLATIEKNWDLGYLAYAADRAQVPALDVFLTP
ncbi:MAG: hypothetical protein H0W87_02730 [Actinobacteria bacterium]|nr:hypothetical protein [Actinomycetota bacterium]